MRKPAFLTAIIATLVFGHARAQVFINGSFEHTASDCKTNISNTDFNTRMPNVFAYGAASQPDLLKDTCKFGPAQDGRYFVGIGINENGLQDALSLSLSAPLTVNKTYMLSYYVKKAADYGGTSYRLGGSTDSSTPGNTILTIPAPTDTTWRKREHSFVPTIPVKFINIAATGMKFNWTHIDHFEISQVSTGVENAAGMAAGFAMTPNPAGNTVWIELGSEFTGDAMITVTDLTGRVLKSVSTSQQTRISADVQDLSAGIYVISASGGNAHACQRLAICR